MSLKERIDEFARDEQESGMLKEIFNDKLRCRFCGDKLVESRVNDSMVECKRDKVVISKKLLWKR